MNVTLTYCRLCYGAVKIPSVGFTLVIRHSAFDLSFLIMLCANECGVRYFKGGRGVAQMLSIPYSLH